MTTLTKNFVWALMLSFTVFLLPEMAMANAFQDGLCKLYKCFFSGTIVSMIATFAVIFLGIGAFFGKVNWGLVIVTLAGLVVVLGASSIIEMFHGDVSGCDTATC